MSIPPEAFRHHPELVGRIGDPLKSFYRDFDYAQADAHMAALGRPPDWRYSDEVREGLRRTALAGREGREVWVFAYGSLMWDTGFLFDEVRHAHLTGYSRKLWLVDRGGPRGTEERPGVMAALGEGGACDGLAFRIPPHLMEEETFRLCRREIIAPGYRIAWVPAATRQGEVEVMAFVADPGAGSMEPDLPRDRQLEYLATGRGWGGSSLEYFQTILAQFAVLGIEDAELAALVAEAEELARTSA